MDMHLYTIAHTSIIMVTCAINSFGWISRLIFQYTFDDPLLDVVHVNNLCLCKLVAYLIKYDSVHGTWDREVTALDYGSGFNVDGKLVTFTRCKDYKDVNWSTMGIKLVMECTGKFLKVEEQLNDYFDICKVKRVVVSAPVKEARCLNMVLGCNNHLLTEELRLVTNASCTIDW